MHFPLVQMYQGKIRIVLNINGLPLRPLREVCGVRRVALSGEPGELAGSIAEPKK